jgi:hypothetical protein
MLSRHAAATFLQVSYPGQIDPVTGKKEASLFFRADVFPKKAAFLFDSCRAINDFNEH